MSVNNERLCCVCKVCMKICELGINCLCVYCILCYMYVQVIIVDGSKVLVFVFMLDKELCQGVIGNVEVVKKVGQLIVECVKVVGVEQVVFDCFGYCYYGCIQVLVDVVCEVGL